MLARFSKFLLTLSLSVICISVSAQEKDRSASLMGKIYQDLTTHYNYYFNSKLDYTENLKQLSDANKDNYNELLSLNELGDSDSRSQGASFDNVIKKTSLAITLHDNSKWVDDCYLLMAKSQYMKGDYSNSIGTFQYIVSEFSDKKRLRPKKNKTGGKNKYKKKPSSKSSSSSRPSAKEYNKKKKKSSKSSGKKSTKDYNKEKKKAAKERAKNASKSRDEEEDKVEEVYEELEEKKSTSKDSEDNSKSDSEEEDAEEEKKGKRQFLGHRKVNHEALIWLAKAYIEEDDHSSAKEVLNTLEEEENLPKRLMDDLYLARAQSAMKRESYSEVQQNLLTAIEYTRKKKDRARYYFIIGQLAQKSNNFAAAAEAFKNVQKMKPSYLMEFNAQLNEVLCSSYASGSNATAISQLNKMIKDGKNKDYLDKIHYKLAEIHAVQGDTEAMLSALKMAASSGDPSGDQLAETYLKLAEVYYDREDYAYSSAYYDSTLAVVSAEHNRYEEIVDRQNILAELVSYLNVIEKEDSLQNLANMSNVLRNEIIDEVIAAYEADASDGSDSKSDVDFKDFADNNFDPRAGVSRPGLGSQSSVGGSFHFYNQAAKARGYSRFKENWGERELTDNWRVSSLNTTAAISFGELDESEQEILELASKGGLTRDFFIKQLPNTPEKVAASNAKIASAMFSAGGVYKDRLYNDEKAIETYTDLNRRFSKNPNKLEALYQLYLLYDRSGPAAKAKSTKNIILNQYKNSIYAKLISDPSYAAELAEASKEANSYYEQTYALYSKGQYKKVKTRLSKAPDMFSENPYQAKYDMLNALAIGETEDETAFASALNNVISLHPEDPVKGRAEEILALLGVKPGKVSNTASVGKSTLKSGEYDPKTSPFKPSMDSKHYFIISFAEFNSKINSLIDQLVILNEESYELEGLKVNQMLLDQKNQLVVVKTFSNGTSALDYYNSLKKNERQYFSGVKGSEFYFFPISKTNFTTYFKDKDPAAYMGFFEAEYLNE